MSSRSPYVPPDQFSYRPTYRHKKRGTTYQIVGHAKMQISEEVCDDFTSLEKMSFIVYRCNHDDTLWVRPESEFFDGRFEEVK